jgi:hypothetical protein
MVAVKGQASLRHPDRPGQTRREAGTQSQGSSSRKTARLPVGSTKNGRRLLKESNVKANLARFTGALAILASLVLTIGAGYRWV